MKALVFKNMVVEFSPNEFPVNSSMVWMDAPQDCKVGWVLNNDTLQEPTPDTMSNREQLESELPSPHQMINALWDWAVNNDKRKLDSLEIEIQSLFDKYNLPRD